MVVGWRERVIAYIGYFLSFLLTLSYGATLAMYGDEIGGGKWLDNSIAPIIAISVLNELSSRSLNRKSSQNTDGSFTPITRKKLAVMYMCSAYLWGIGCILAIGWEVVSHA